MVTKRLVWQQLGPAVCALGLLNLLGFVQRTTISNLNSLNPQTKVLVAYTEMEGSFRDDLKNIIQFNLVPKVEPNDGEFVLCGEFVDGVPPASTMPLPHTEDCKDPLTEGITGDNPFGLKELKIVAKDCMKELAAIKADIKVEPEENIYDDSLGHQEVDELSTDEQIAEHQTESEPKTGWIYTLKKARVTEELRNFGLPTKGKVYDQCRRLSNFIRTGNYQPTESTSAASPEDPKSPINVSSNKRNIAQWIPQISSALLPEKILSPAKKWKKGSHEYETESEPKTGWIYTLKRARVIEELQNLGLPTKGDSYEQCRRLSNFIRTGKYQPTESTSAASPEDPKSNTSSSESDHDASYNPKRKFGMSASRKKSSTVKKEKSNKGKKTSEKIDPDKEKAIKVLPSLIPTTVVSEGEQRSPQSNSASLPETTLSPAKKKHSYNYKEARSSKSDHDKSYSPKRSFRISGSSKKSSTVKKGNSNECKQTHTVSNKEKLKSDSPHINDDALKNPQTLLTALLKDSLPLPEKASLPVKKNDSGGDKAEVDGVLWSCCDMQFELFSAYNDHKAQVHLIEELTCSICIDQSFSSLDEIEKHYLDVHTDSSWKSFHCLDCRLVFGIKSSFFDHKAKCCESRNVCSGILDSILDFAVTRKKSKKVKGSGNTAFRLSCCDTIIKNFEDFFFHKFSDHNISLLTCGLCLCVKDTEAQLRSHYRKFHFSKFWRRLELRRCGDNEEDPASTVSSSTQNDDVLNEAEDGPSGSDNVRAKPVQCSALQDGILCQCCNCTKLLEEKRSLPLHLKNLSSVNVIAIALKKPFQCKPCNLRFRFKDRLDKHLRTHEGIKPFPCDECGSAFTCKGSLQDHKLYKHSSNPFQKTCSICDKVFVSKATLKRHIASIHMCVEKNIQFKCEHCEKMYKNRTSYLRHVRHFHTKLKKFICDHCSNIFYDKRLLISHMQSMHLPNEKFECQKCDCFFKSNDRLKAHNYRKHSDRQFNCEVCGKIFRNKINLVEHMSVHSDDKPFICQICGKRFKRYMNLQQHQYSHSDSRPHVCDICGQTFRLRTHVKQHMAVHGVIKNHKCPICEKTFAKKTELKSHLSTHGI